jgi:hypothetical protein
MLSLYAYQLLHYKHASMLPFLITLYCHPPTDSDLLLGFFLTMLLQLHNFKAMNGRMTETEAS